MASSLILPSTSPDILKTLDLLFQKSDFTPTQRDDTQPKPLNIDALYKASQETENCTKLFKAMGDEIRADSGELGEQVLDLQVVLDSIKQLHGSAQDVEKATHALVRLHLRLVVEVAEILDKRSLHVSRSAIKRAVAPHLKNVNCIDEEIKTQMTVVSEYVQGMFEQLEDLSTCVERLNHKFTKSACNRFLGFLKNLFRAVTSLITSAASYTPEGPISTGLALIQSGTAAITPWTGISTLLRDKTKSDHTKLCELLTRLIPVHVNNVMGSLKSINIQLNVQRVLTDAHADVALRRRQTRTTDVREEPRALMLERR